VRWRRPLAGSDWLRRGGTEELAVPLDFSNLDQLRAQYGQVRQFSPQLLRTLEFRSIPRLKPLMKAVDVLRALNETKNRSSLGRSERVHPAVLAAVCLNGKKVDRAYYELCVLTELSLGLRSVTFGWPGSRRFLPLEDTSYLQDTWKASPEPNRSAVSIWRRAKANFTKLLSRCRSRLQQVNYPTSRSKTAGSASHLTAHQPSS